MIRNYCLSSVIIVLRIFDEKKKNGENDKEGNSEEEHDS